MNWIPNNHKPQLSVACPPRFRGNRAYVSRSESRRSRSNAPPLLGVLPFGKHKNKPLVSVPGGYLRWFLKEVTGRELVKRAVRSELAAREEAGKLMHPTEPASDDANLD